MAAKSRPAPATRFSHEKIRALRESLGLSQAEFARKIGFTRAHVSQVERGPAHGTQPSMNYLRAVAKAFDVDLRYFWT